MIGSYRHTQKGILQPLLLAASVLFLAGALVKWSAGPWGPVLLAAAVVGAALSFAFGRLTIEDGGDRLLVRFGPLALFRREIPYREMAAVERTRSPLLAGWGIHWTRRGWLWNIGGFDCVRVVLGGGKGVLLGTDDPESLLGFLRARIGEGGTSSDSISGTPDFH